MKTAKLSLTLVSGALLACMLTSCVNLRRADEPAHYYMLSAVLARTTPVATSDGELAVGLGAIEIPSYALDRRIAVCRGAHEINYLEYDRWAERLDKGIQRAVAANLASVLPSDRVLTSAWRREDVGAEVYISIRGFESDQDGRVILQGSWRVTSPGGETPWRAGHFHVAKKCPPFRGDPKRAIDELSHALADLSQQIAADLRDVSTQPAITKAEPRR